MLLRDSSNLKFSEKTQAAEGGKLTKNSLKKFSKLVTILFLKSSNFLAEDILRFKLSVTIEGAELSITALEQNLVLNFLRMGEKCGDVTLALRFFGLGHTA